MSLYRILDSAFGISELKESKILQVVSLGFFLSFIITFYGWTSSNVADNVCSPHISNCDFYKSLLWFMGFPSSYELSTFYVLLLGVIFIWLYALYKNDHEVVWYSILILFLYKWLHIYVFSSGNYDYYDIVLVAVFLFAKNKLYFLRITYVLLYFLAATIKFHPGWVLWTYFTTLQTGIPIFPDATTALWTNLVILTQILLCWGLFMKKNTLLFIIAEIFFLAFHFYSWILVEYRYLLTAIPMMVVLFVLPEYVSYKKTKNIFIYIFISILFLLQSIAFLIPWDQKLTLEGNKYGLYMFEANHQCITRYEFFSPDGKSNSQTTTSKVARDRCDPYTAVEKYKKFCTKNIERISITHDHSINGGPFYRIVDEYNLCNLNYRPFVHNSWIKSELEGPQIVGFPVKNFFTGNNSITSTPTISGSLIILPWLENNEPTSYNSLQNTLLPYTGKIIYIYWSIWIITLIAITSIHITKIRALNKQSQKKWQKVTTISIKL